MKRSLLITVLVCILLFACISNLVSRQTLAAAPANAPAPRPACLLAGPCEKGHAAAEIYLPAVHLPGNY